ncbi:hypothetical protein [Flavobacterium sp. B183]|uniref:hypothetical protein n=1 Tax=Flavobacterium sp. B183 TaxID=907046 RepID=UPI00201F38E5|nr:hypothetical protein [Flavobacterium sp. B183]URC11670.1 hypothetical protein M4I44_16395 [Flavobacterium sp. B183]
MLNISVIKAKFKRSGLNFKSTFIFDENSHQVNPKDLFVFQANEKCIIYFTRDNNYSWYLTNKRLIIPVENKFISLSDLTKIDFPNIKNNPSSKMENAELTLFTNSNQFKLFLEENSWHVFYNIFKFIIDKNN